MDRKKETIKRSKTFSRISGLIHGFSDRSWGDMRISKNRDHFLSSLGLGDHELYWKGQMHSDVIHCIDADTDISLLPGADGAIVLGRALKKRKIAVTVRSADCVPLLFLDPKTKMIGIVHAGWQGTLLKIAGKAVSLMKQNGSNTRDIYVYIGSHIGPCCYCTDKLRADKFRNTYKDPNDVVSVRSGIQYVDLGKANTIDLIQSGIKPSHIELDKTCTSCFSHKKFSYRKDTPESYGVMMGVIAWK